MKFFLDFSLSASQQAQQQQILAERDQVIKDQEKRIRELCQLVRQLKKNIKNLNRELAKKKNIRVIKASQKLPQDESNPAVMQLIRELSAAQQEVVFLQSLNQKLTRQVHHLQATVVNQRKLIDLASQSANQPGVPVMTH